MNRFLKLLPGKSLHLPCAALGKPRPKLTWLHDGTKLESSSSSLELKNLSIPDSGIYTCLATNLAGTTKLQFSVTVEEPRVELPKISLVSNTSAMVGETAVLQCRVTSMLQPSIQWLRETKGSRRSRTIRLDDMEMVSMGEGKQVKVADSVYLNTFIINSVQEEDEGLYVCLATNYAGGYEVPSRASQFLKI